MKGINHLSWFVLLPFLLLSCLQQPVRFESEIAEGAAEPSGVRLDESKQPRDGILTALKDTPWILVELYGAPPQPGPEGHFIDLLFEAEANRFSGWSGCNRYFGTYQLAGADRVGISDDATPAPDLTPITFGPIGSTKRACPGGSSEMQLFQALAAAKYVTTTSDSLILLDGDRNELVRFRRKE
jgi:heat shock protein HslJ